MPPRIITPIHPNPREPFLDSCGLHAHNLCECKTYLTVLGALDRELESALEIAETRELIINEFSRHRNYYLAVAARAIGMEFSEDVVQEAFSRAIHKAADFRGECALRPWLVSIVRNVACEFWRKEKCRPVYSGMPEYFDIQDPESLEIKDDPRLAILRVNIAKLAPMYRDAIKVSMQPGRDNLSPLIRLRKFHAIRMLRRMTWS